MERPINSSSGRFNSNHIKEGIIVRKRNRDFVGIVVESSKGVYIRTPTDQLFGLEVNVNQLILKFESTYLFSLL